MGQSFELSSFVNQLLYQGTIAFVVVNGCVYCPYHLKNKTIARKKLTQEEIRKEVIALQDMGHKRLALEAGEDPLRNPIEYILESIQTIYSIKHKNGAIRRVNVNIAATTVENYRKLKDAGIGTYILFQETYHKENYESLHPVPGVCVPCLARQLPPYGSLLVSAFCVLWSCSSNDKGSRRIRSHNNWKDIEGRTLQYGCRKTYV